MFPWPVPGHYGVSSHFGEPRPGGLLHLGFDVPAPIGAPLVAIGAGKIIFTGWAGSAGRSVWLDMGTFRVHYCHLSAFNVTAGQVVATGDVIGWVGGSGDGRDGIYGSHLHLNLFAAERPTTGPSHWVGWVGMWAIDPELYVSKENTMSAEHDQHHQQLADRTKNLEHWLGAHMQAHQGTFDPNIRALNDRVGTLESRPATGSDRSGAHEH